MIFNTLSWRQRILVGSGALLVTVPLCLYMNEIGKARHLARSGMHVDARISELHPEPKSGKAHSVYSYSYNGKEYFGTIAGASDRSIGERLRVTIDPASPAESWPGDAKAEVPGLIWGSIFGGTWLAIGIAVLCGPRKERGFPRNHLLSE